MYNMKYLFIQINIRDGERVHNHRVVIQTKCKNLRFAAQYYIAHYWGESKHDGEGSWYAHGGEIALTLDFFKVISKSTYKLLNNLFY